MSAIIEIKDLSKNFARRLAVNNVNLSIESGEIFCSSLIAARSQWADIQSANFPARRAA